MSKEDFGQTRFRRSPHLTCYWKGGDFIVQNYATGAAVVGRPITCDILNFFGDWRPARDLFADKRGWDRTGLRRLLTAFVRHSLLQRDDRDISVEEKAMDGWTQWNPAAGFFHTATKDVQFDDENTSVRLLRRQSRVVPMPHPVKRYESSRVFELPPVVTTGEFPRVLLARRTWRRFASKPVDLASFSTLLGLTAGIQHWAHASGEGKVALKTSPSGGARHAIELYVLALNVKGLPRGLYHYAADAHALEPISRRVDRRLVERYLPVQEWYRHSSALLLFTAVFPRELWRYTYARAYRAVFIEAGHLCQTLCLTATWLGLAPFCTMALADSRIEKDLGLDGISESVLYAAGVGTRPTDAAPPATRASRPSMLTRREVRTFPGRIVHKSR